MPEPNSETTKRLFSKISEIEGRVFTIDLFKLSNGCFANISEDPAPRLGTITISIRSEQGVSSSTLIPDRRGSIFSGMLGEMIAGKMRGIAVVSLYLREEIDSSIMKILLSEVGKLLETE
jgi:hypothetical protein